MTRRLGAAVASLLALLAFTTVTAGGSAGATDGPMYGAPSAGRCYDLSYAAASAPSAPGGSVACSQAHRLYILKVAQLPASMTYTSSGFPRFFNTACTPPTANALDTSWTTYLRSSYVRFYFEPTDTQKSHGAHWISCLLGRLRDVNTLARTTGRPHLGTSLSAKETMCMTRRFAFTNCAQSHRYHTVATSTITFPGSLAKAGRACMAKVPALRNDASWGVRWTGIKDGTVDGVLCLNN